MALEKCKECGNEVSSTATSCPNCGFIQNKKIGWLTYIAAGFLILIVVISLRKENHSTCDTSEHESVASESVDKENKPQ